MDPATMTAVGSLLGGAGSLASAFGGGGNKVDEGAVRGLNDINGRHQKDMEYILRQQEFNQKMALAKEHGLHPLSVLGVNVGGSTITPSVVGSGAQDTGPDFEKIGYGANQVLRSFVKPEAADVAEPDPMAARILDANVRTAEANANRAEWDALRSQFNAEDMARVNLMGQPGNPPGVRTSNDVTRITDFVAHQSGIPNYYTRPGGPVEVKQTVAPAHPRNLGHTAATDQAWQTIMDQNGKPTSVVRSEAVQADIEKGATFQWAAKMFGVENALKITAIMENENLLIGGAAGLAFALSRIPGGRAVATRMGLLKPLTQPYKPNWKGGK
ncbi:MAG: DNA pilot protein [Arizlama microvirus]|nr:MAG: DNA pilot protein [Arizlama microvirus]